MKTCKECGSPKIPPTFLKRRHYLCTRCSNATPAALRARKRWIQKRRQTAEGQAYERQQNARRIRYNNQHFGYAETPEQKQAITRHIRQRVTEFTREIKRREPIA